MVLFNTIFILKTIRIIPCRRFLPKYMAINFKCYHIKQVELYWSIHDIVTSHTTSVPTHLSSAGYTEWLTCWKVTWAYFGIPSYLTHQTSCLYQFSRLFEEPIMNNKCTTSHQKITGIFRACFARAIDQAQISLDKVESLKRKRHWLREKTLFSLLWSSPKWVNHSQTISC